ncbi:flavin-containing monooxygenase FMO GS-OX5-like [Coffea eugenioides]|uniref:flavin-containing monooxygenase FMO GS-OX5-like n=1 Tax=Coffea eugenioides TaxID=49369 RepID=UPI000F6155AE|nr:flavin-containing monooxygenase FMO GS-OX5-like [Coffea eugenioides]
MARPLKVAVIGAGVAGLTTACELKSEGHQVVVYEKADQIGGMWVYNPEVETDPLGLDPGRKIVHSSLYHSLKTNLPRPLMRFWDYPFTVKNKDGVLMDFPGHEEVLQFLNNFAEDFGLVELIRLNTEVVRVEQENDDQWVVESRSNGGLISEEPFEAVVVCNGHNTQPRVAELPGINNWKGKQIHCHNYRVPEPFRDQVVVIIGGAASANDISLEIVEVAKEVHLSSRSQEIEVKKWDMYDNLWQHSKVTNCYENGEIAFEDGALVTADIILHCTGYKYNLPFLKTNGVITIDDDNRVGPLYKHVFPPQLAPRLSFVGIPRVAINFVMIDLQAKWVASVLSGKVSLPSEEDMSADLEQCYRLLEEKGIPKHHTHSLDLNMHEYLDWVAAQVGLPPVDKRQKEIFYKIREILPTSWIGFREMLLKQLPWISRIS